MMILNRTDNPLSRIERNKLNNNWDLIERGVSDVDWKAKNALDVANALITNSFDDAALQTNIGEKLNDLETQYAPKLSKIEDNLDFIRTIQGRKRCVAHRGAEEIAPENTYPAFVKAGELGFWGAECDVQWSIDNVPIIYHDEDVSSYTNGEGILSRKTFAELKALYVDSGKNVSMYGTSLRLCSFEEYVKVCKQYNLKCFIEIKYYTTTLLSEQNIDSLVSILEKHGMVKQAIIMHISENVLLRFRARNKNLTILFMVADNHSIENMEWMVMNSPCIAGCNFNHTTLTQTVIDMYHERNIPVCVYTMTHLHDAQIWIRKGVDILISRLFISEVMSG